MTYTYECKECNHIFDIEKGINEEVEVKCEECNGEVKRIYSPIRAVWKTGGNFGVEKQ